MAESQAQTEQTEGSKESKKEISARFSRERILVDEGSEAQSLYDSGRYGVLLENGKLHLSLIEALYLMEKKKLKILDGKKKPIKFDVFISKAQKLEPNFWIRYCVYKDIRNRGYIIKTALKFGADFRVYDRGVKPGEDHARWIVYPVHEGSTLTWYEFAAKNRVAHSTKKRLLMGIVDDEADVTYYEIAWKRP